MRRVIDGEADPRLTSNANHVGPEVRVMAVARFQPDAALAPDFAALAEERFDGGGDGVGCE
jgi:hypothetical protein